ncbi:MAG: insulinase family protein [Nitratireductor sp.]|nr:insulinase family protein [Nitratireductor sp.]MCC0020582.1 insulinase family protein [Nitratireductor sp.]
MSVEVTTLENGITLAIDRMQHLETVAFGTWVRAGARNEREDQHGIAHLLEHMAFKGTPTRSARQIAEEIENVGGDVNASTSVEMTSYHARMLGEDLPLGMDVLHDILRNSTYCADELEREKHVILQEIGAANDTPDDLCFDLFQDAAYGGQPIGRPILGTPETVTAFTSNDIKDYLGTHYRAPNMIISAAGKVDSDAFKKQAEELYSDFPSELSEPCPPSKYLGGQSLVHRETAETQIVLGFEGRAYHVRDFYASNLLSMILGGGMSSRLFQEIREKRGYCYSIYSFHWGFSDSGVFGIHAATGKEDVKQLMPLLLDELHRASEDISEAEVDRARAQIKASLMMAMESPASRAGQIARQIMLFGRPIPNDELMERLQAISAERLRDLAGRLFCETVPTISAVGDISGVMNQHEIASALGSTKLLAAE